MAWKHPCCRCCLLAIGSFPPSLPPLADPCLTWRRQVARLCQFMGEHHTNNQAEYAGLIGGLQAALDMGCRSIKVQGDSTLIIRQARQRCRCGGGGGGGGGRLHLAWQLRCS